MMSYTTVDRQGADSLLNGLPLNKIYNLLVELAPIKLLYPFSKRLISKNKLPPLYREICCISKDSICLAQSDFRYSILNAMVENDSMVESLEFESISLSEIGFLYDELIQKLISLDNSLTMNAGLYKYPITKLAQKYWPGFFERSTTSPFQADFTIGTSDLRQYLINYNNENSKK